MQTRGRSDRPSQCLHPNNALRTTLFLLPYPRTYLHNSGEHSRGKSWANPTVSPACPSLHLLSSSFRPQRSIARLAGSMGEQREPEWSATQQKSHRGKEKRAQESTHSRALSYKPFARTTVPPPISTHSSPNSRTRPASPASATTGWINATTAVAGLAPPFYRPALAGEGDAWLADALVHRLGPPRRVRLAPTGTGAQTGTAPRTTTGVGVSGLPPVGRVPTASLVIPLGSYVRTPCSRVGSHASSPSGSAPSGGAVYSSSTSTPPLTRRAAGNVSRRCRRARAKQRRVDSRCFENRHMTNGDGNGMAV